MQPTLQTIPNKSNQAFDAKLHCRSPLLYDHGTLEELHQNGAMLSVSVPKDPQPTSGGRHCEMALTNPELLQGFG